MAKCKTCKHTNWCKDEEGRRYNWCPIIDDCPDLEADRDCDKHETMTNADRIRAMSDEELEEFLAKYGMCELCEYNNKKCQGASCKSGYTKWLQSEVE